MKPLEGLKVLDLSRVLAGPYCTMMLADFGANIIKIEPPKTGDDSRAFGPFVGKESAYFMSLNRNKRSICLDLKQPGAASSMSPISIPSRTLLARLSTSVSDKNRAYFSRPNARHTSSSSRSFV